MTTSKSRCAVLPSVASRASTDVWPNRLLMPRRPCTNMSPSIHPLVAALCTGCSWQCSGVLHLRPDKPYEITIFSAVRKEPELVPAIRKLQASSPDGVKAWRTSIHRPFTPCPQNRCWVFWSFSTWMLAQHHAGWRSPPCYAGRCSPALGAGNLLSRGDVTDLPPASATGPFRQLGPVLTAAVMFTVSDVFGKLALEGGTDVLSLLSFRSVLGIGLIFLWLRLGEPAVALSPTAKWISIALGVLLTANLFGLFKAIELIPVSIAILTYFIYPLLTGIMGAATGADRLTLTGAVIAVVAFFGLALIIGANPADLAILGLVAA